MMEREVFHGSEGFTLLEVLIAIAIFSFIMIGVYQMTDNSARTKDTIQREDSELLQFEMALSRIEMDIEYMHSPLFYESTKKNDDIYLAKFTGKTTKTSQAQDNPYGNTDQYTNSKIFTGLSESNKPIPKLQSEEKGELIFMTSAGRRLLKNTKQSNLFWVRYRVINDDNPLSEESPYALTRTVIASDIYKSDLDWDKAKEYIMIKGLVDFEFHYWNSKKEDYVDQLRLLPEEEQLRPKLVKLVISYSGSTGEKYEGERVYRPLWPNIDTSKLLEEKYQEKKTTTPTGGQQN